MAKKPAKKGAPKKAGAKKARTSKVEIYVEE
jgi:hypothetical protein